MSRKKEVRAYETANGKVPIYDWVDGRINRRLERLQEGHYGDFKSIGEGVSEMRLQFGAGYRIYFGEINAHIVLLLVGGDKSTQSKDIKLAQRYWHEFKNRRKR